MWLAKDSTNSAPSNGHDGPDVLAEAIGALPSPLDFRLVDLYRILAGQGLLWARLTAELQARSYSVYRTGPGHLMASGPGLYARGGCPGRCLPWGVARGQSTKDVL